MLIGASLIIFLYNFCGPLALIPIMCLALFSNNDRALLCMWILFELAPASSAVLARSSGAKSLSCLQLLSVVAMGNVTSAGHSSAISQTS